MSTLDNGNIVNRHMMHVLVATAEEEVYRGDALRVVAPGTAGSLAILPNHAPLLATIRAGVLRIDCCHEKQEQRCLHVVVIGGFLEVHANNVTILADAIERAHDIDEARAQKALHQAQSEAQTTGHTERTMLALEVSLARLQVVRQRLGGNR
ncbi:ATP synthase F1 subunit epsilon [Mariprofundus ferrooxydans]|uniref:ATP synthase epsilon chain n=1 Tax=Mariprofundus ferrooxydans PV-1 TaxID=314345 RepID=Q0F2X7_9PROT|nr:ATP synthase F1 subunit epsilon [Mariprofundus ferrooxydans]EAU56164.1 ATP synthase epsilon chain [Mariprofundus ferrooxydans PV-1]